MSCSNLSWSNISCSTIMYLNYVNLFSIFVSRVKYPRNLAFHPRLLWFPAARVWLGLTRAIYPRNLAFHPRLLWVPAPRVWIGLTRAIYPRNLAFHPWMLWVPTARGWLGLTRAEDPRNLAFHPRLFWIPAPRVWLGLTWAIYQRNLVFHPRLLWVPAPRANIARCGGHRGRSLKAAFSAEFQAFLVVCQSATVPVPVVHSSSSSLYSSSS